jgi:hypothetical protein
MTLPSRLRRNAARTIRMAALAVLLGTAATGTAMSQDMGPLTPHLQSGEDAPWTARAEGASFTLANTSDPAAIRYYWTGSPAEEEGKRSIAVDVEVRDGQEGSGAGILYGYRDEPRSYFLLLLRPNGLVTLSQRVPEGFEERMSIGGDAVKPGVNRLEVRENGSTIEMLLNGQSIGSLGNDLIGRGGVGIVAVGTGTFSFANYTQALAQ